AAPTLSTDLLAIVVAVVAFVVSGIFLLTLMPERSRGPTHAVAARPGPALANDTGDQLELAEVSLATSHTQGLGVGTFGPLGGAGGPPRRMARNLPVERAGGTKFVPIDDVVAIHANAHYSYVFDGKAKLFCPLAIGIVESRLDTARFVR